MQRILVTASLALVLSLASAPKAEAQDIGNAVIDISLVGSFGLTSIGIAIADLVSLAADRPSGVGLVVADFLVGAASIGVGIWLACYTHDHDDQSPVLPSFSAAFLALGALEIVHGAWSLGTRANAPTLALSPTTDGAFASLSGTF